MKDKMKDADFIFLAKNKDGKRSFPDGEIYAAIPEVSSLSKKRVIVLHSGSPNPNDGLVELEMVLQILKDRRIKPEVFFTYFPYGRQDKIFEPGETCAAQNLIKKLVNYYKVKQIYIIDPHFGKDEWIKKYPIMGISAVPYLMVKSKKDFGNNILFLSPDKGGMKRTGIFGLDKKRINSFETKLLSPKIAIKGKIVGVVDDIIGTGGTLLRFHEFVKKSGAEKVIALITHGVLDGGIGRIKNTFTKLYLTNTVNKKETNVDITGLIVKAIIK